MFKVTYYKVRWNKYLRWEEAWRCKKVAEIKILSGRLSIGKGFYMNRGSYIAVVDGGNATIGKNVNINRHSMIVCQDSITIGNDCSIGPNVLIYDHDHKFGAQGMKKGHNKSPVSIGNQCWIGGGAMILRGTTIGDGCIIGAGSIVKGTIPPYSLVTSSSRELTITPLQERSHSVFRSGV